MKKLIALTILLLTAVVLVTLLYFKNLNITGKDTARLLQSIPSDAALVLNFSNDESFYSIYDSSTLFTAITGTEQLHEFALIGQHLLQQPTIKTWLAEQPVYVSVHADGSLLFTMHTDSEFKIPVVIAALKQNEPQLRAYAITTNKIKGFILQLPGVDSLFTVIDRGSHIYSGSFSQNLIQSITAQHTDSAPAHFTPLSDQLQGNALANLYINYSKLPALFGHWYQAKNPALFKPLLMLPAQAALTLNYKTDALMFSGYTTPEASLPATYLSLFQNQKPYHIQLKNIFPLITAYSTSFAVSNPAQFQQDLAAWQAKAGISKERQQLFAKIKAETGVAISTEFENSLGNEFAVLTTRFDEQLCIIQVKNGNALRPVLDNISTIGADSVTHRFNYAKLPYLLLGDAFSAFRQPYYMVLDNYLVLVNSAMALVNYKRIYDSQTFASRNETFNNFDNLLSAQCNVSFYINYKNASYILKRDLQPNAYHILYPKPFGKGSFYAGAYQLSGAHQQFYTNFCMQLDQTDTITEKD